MSAQPQVDKVRKTVTMKDVALRAGVGHSCVSVVLNGSRCNTSVSPETRQRILSAAEELGYRRNGSAHIIRTGRFGNISLLLSPLKSHSYIPTPLLAGLHDSLALADMSLTVCVLPDEEIIQSGTLPKILRERMCDGLLINYNLGIPEAGVPQAMIQSIRRHHIPAVWINSKQQSDCVYPDDFDAAMQATRHLLSLGHRRIAYVDFSNNPDHHLCHYSAIDRSDGYATAMVEAGLEPQFCMSYSSDLTELELGQNLLASPDRPTAVISYAAWSMQGVLRAADRLDISVPDDLSIITFGPEQANYGGLSVTTMIEPQEEIAAIAMQMIMSKINNPVGAVEPKTAKFNLLPGQTTLPCVSSSKQKAEVTV